MHTKSGKINVLRLVISMDKWVVKERNVSICEECGGSMALWFNKENGKYCVFCDYCPNEYFFTKEQFEFAETLTKYRKEHNNGEK